jgi:hypothetical protein
MNVPHPTRDDLREVVERRRAWPDELFDPGEQGLRSG